MANPDLPLIHILLDPSGAYLCLDYDQVCSHLDSLLTRIRVSISRNDKLRPTQDSNKWRAYCEAPIVHEQVTMLPDRELRRVQVRETKEHLIYPKAA